MAVPVATAVASPALLTVATAVFEEIHDELLVTFCVLLSLYVPIAANGCVVPAAIDGFDGVTAIDTSVGVTTWPARNASMPVTKSPKLAAVAVNVAAIAPADACVRSSLAAV